VRRASPLRPRDRADAIHLEVIAKPGGGTRTLAHLDAGDRRRYDRAVGAVTRYVERLVPSRSIANRAVVTPRGLALEPWIDARSRYVRAIAEASAATHRAAFVGDVRDCYGSITPQVVWPTLRAAGVPLPAAARICGILRDFETRGVRGLPIGPVPSAVLANAVLVPVDRALADAVDGPAFRWVDDVVAFVTHARAAEAAAAAFGRALGELGLSAHPEKCTVVVDRQALLSRASMPSASAARGVA